MQIDEKYLVSLKLILRNADGHVLGLKGVQKGTFAGFYDLPGGRIDVSEFMTSFEEVLRREAVEEIGAVKFTLISSRPVAIGRHIIKAEHTSSKVKDVPVLYVFFEGVCSGSPEITVSGEHEGYAWIDLEHGQLADYFTSGILEGVQMYLNHSPTL